MRQQTMVDMDHDDEDWGDDQDDASTILCPACGAAVFDDLERCPRCGRSLSIDHPRTRQPWWVVAGVLVCLAMVIYWILHP